jgi:transposase InsO family protein
LIVYSDGGGQYASDDFRSVLKKHDFIQSMTRKDNHYNNAMGESDRRSVFSVDSKPN